MAEDPRNYFPIRKIINGYPNIFLDTNIFLHIVANLDKDKKENYIPFTRTKEQLLDFWIPILKENPRIYLTKNILGEFARDHFKYKKELKKNTPYDEKYTEIRRIKKRLKNKRNSLLDEFPSDRIVDVNTLGNLQEKALYYEFYEKYDYLVKISKRIKENGLDLLLLGAVFSKLRGNTCLISNNFDILRCYNSFLNKENMDKKNFGFYFQQGLDFFKKA
jgi:hypothetical protein